MAFRKRKAADNLFGQVRPASPFPEGKKLSLEFCKSFLRESGREYTDEQVAQIREVLYRFAEIDYLITTTKAMVEPEETEKPHAHLL